MSGRGRARSVAERLGPRDLAMLASLQDLHLATGAQLGRLHVVGAHPATWARKTRATLQRLSVLGLVVRLRRRIGGIRSGSAGYIYGLSGLGQAVLDLGQDAAGRHRRVNETKPAFQNHTLAVSETYVQLVERARTGHGELLDFASEPDCWRRFSGGAGEVVTLKPDAFVRLGVGGYEVSAFLEADLDSESAPTIRRKLDVYLAYWRSGIEQRHYDVFPKVWWLVPDVARLEVVARTIHQVPSEGQQLFTVCRLGEAAELLTQPVADEGGAR
jgi:hypothetical protein